ncbi:MULTISPECIES: acyl-[acyl-carrier-protein] thioesterase [Sellimonas]|uniref:Acyl-[acyl-carrier-protein] thioesterase n=1 Tax=Sellimonas caecigallum TaxID=2592333 RepID=A0ABS7L5S8_9FIRM|nr:MULTISPECIES: acyl-ACP thioesterase domain-containing protein [Sellimonas]MBY0758272.1 acyl-[acyl-carrier-protein] thioesterase [Sellimonas caecigallum]OUP62711.1 acyl-[acyl-carrier-protein] thioesterase [Drancourtella sp. An177]
MKYERKERIRFSEVGNGGYITLSGIIDHFQDISIFQSEDLKLGTMYLKEKNRAWVLSAWQVEVKRYPRLGEYVHVSTWASGFRSFFGERNFVMTDEEGIDVAYANSVWVYIDTTTGRPAKPSEEEVEKYGINDPYPMNYASRKVPAPKSGIKREPFPVRKYQIDTNQHVNNCQYVQMAVEELEEELGRTLDIRKLRAEYKNSAVYGDIIYPVLEDTGELYRAALCDKDGKPYAVIELEDKGEER